MNDLMFSLPPIYSTISRRDLEKNTTNKRKPIKINPYKSLFEDNNTEDVSKNNMVILFELR